MAYTPTVWETGDLITAEKLNKAEQGIESASDEVIYASITTQDGVTYDLSVDPSVLADAVDAGKLVVISDEVSYFGLSILSGGEGEYYAMPMRFTRQTEPPAMFIQFAEIDVYTDGTDWTVTYETHAIPITDE